MESSPAATVPLRVMTYNVHSCVGTDGRRSADRIAEVIASTEPDIVALQELDVGRARSGNVDQAGQIATQLKMHFHFHPALRVAEELYGDAILCRFPMKILKADALPHLAVSWFVETRGALLVSATIAGRDVRILNTHFGLARRERCQQAESMAAHWLSACEPELPLIFCADLNSLPLSRPVRLLRRGLRDVQIGGFLSRRTFPSRFPLFPLDYIFVRGPVRVVSTEVLKTPLTRAASDHLPLVVTLAVEGEPS